MVPRGLLGGSGGVVKSLDFCPESLKSSPLAAFTSGAYFLHNGRRWQWICEFYTANFKDIFLGPQSECVWQQAVACAIGCPKMHFFHELTIFWSAEKQYKDFFFSTLHPLSPVIFATATVVAFVLLRSSRFNFHCYTQCEATPTQKSARKWCCDLSRLLARKITKGIHLCKPASLNRPVLNISLRPSG